MDDDDLDVTLDDELYVLLDDLPEDGEGLRDGPRPSLGATLRAAGDRARALRADRPSLPRADRRAVLRVGTLALVVAVSAGASAIATSWWDGASARAKRADTVSLKLNSVTGGTSPASAALAGAGTNSGSASGSLSGTNTGSGTSAGSGKNGTVGSRSGTLAEYVLEIADNGPVPVTVSDARADALPTFSTVGWHPLGPATIAAGGIGRVAVDVLLDCGGLPGSAAGASAGGGRTEFPDPRLTVTTPKGSRHTVVLAADPVAIPLADQQDALAQIVALTDDPCHPAAADPAAVPHGGTNHVVPSATVPAEGAHVRLTYDGVAVPATGPLGSFGIDVTAVDLDPYPVTIDTRLFGAIPITVTDTAGRVTVAPGQPVRFRVTVKMGFCDTTTTDPQAVLDTPAFVVDYGTGETEALPLASLVADAGLRLAGDLAAQIGVVCP